VFLHFPNVKIHEDPTTTDLVQYGGMHRPTAFVIGVPQRFERALKCAGTHQAEGLTR
jgi:hypothetical protein